MQNLGEGVCLLVFFFSHGLVSRSINTAGAQRQNSQRERQLVNQKTVFTSAHLLAKAAYDNVIRVTGIIYEGKFAFQNRLCKPYSWK